MDQNNEANQNTDTLSSHLSISKLAELEPNFFYCDPQTTLDSIAQPIKIPVKLKSHCVTLSLVNILGPYDNNKLGGRNIVLIGKCIHDYYRNVLISVKLSAPFYEEISTDRIDHKFTLQNFLTLPFLNFCFVSANSDSSYLPEQFHKFFIFASSELKSVLKFAGHAPEPVLTVIEASNEANNFISEENETLSDLSSIDLPNIPMHSTVHCSPNNVCGKSFNVIQASREKNTIQVPTLSLSSQDYCFEYLFQSNVDLIEDQDVQLDLLSNLSYPDSSLQNYHFANVVGFIDDFIVRNNRILLHIFDETTENFAIHLGFRPMECVLSDASQNNDLFFPSNCVQCYPPLLCGSIICIRNLCLATMSTNICAHPQQITLVDFYGYDNKITVYDKKKLTKQELIRVAELSLFFSKRLVLEPMVKSASQIFTDSSYRASFVGQILAKRFFKNRVDVFVCVAFQLFAPTHFKDFSFISQQIANMSFCSTRFAYTNDLIEKLIKNKHVVQISIYGSSMCNFHSILPLDFVAFFNTLIQPDKYSKDFYKYKLLESNEFCCRCFRVDKNCLWGQEVAKIYSDIFKSLLTVKLKRDTLLSPFTFNLDDSISSRISDMNLPLFSGTMDSKRLKHHSESARKIPTFEIPEKVTILQSSLDTKNAKIVESFSDMVKDSENDLFCLSARMVNHNFEERDGFPIQSMLALRKNFLFVVCKATGCDFQEPYNSMLPQIAQLIASNHRNIPHIKCHKCETEMEPCFLLCFTLRDKLDMHFEVKILSPEIENLFGCTKKQLLYDDPLSWDVCKAIEFLLNSFCPERRIDNKSFSVSDQIEQSFENNPIFDWFIQGVPDNSPKSDFCPETDNNLPYCQYYVRGIVQKKW